MTAKQDLLAHLRELHTGSLNDRRRGMRISDRSTFAELARAHADIHWRSYCSHYHAGPNPGPWLRPPGWKTGKDVVMRGDIRGVLGRKPTTKAGS
jgi:hypothetical protein